MLCVLIFALFPRETVIVLPYMSIEVAGGYSYNSP